MSDFVRRIVAALGFAGFPAYAARARGLFQIGGCAVLPVGKGVMEALQLHLRINQCEKQPMGIARLHVGAEYRL